MTPHLDFCIWEWSCHEAKRVSLFRLFPFPSPYLFFISLFVSVNPFIWNHAMPPGTLVRPFPKHPVASKFSHLAPYLKIGILLMVFSVYLCTFGHFYSILSVTKTARSSLDAETDVMIILRDADYPYKVRGWVVKRCPYGVIASRRMLCVTERY